MTAADKLRRLAELRDRATEGEWKAGTDEYNMIRYIEGPEGREVAEVPSGTAQDQEDRDSFAFIVALANVTPEFWRSVADLIEAVEEYHDAGKIISSNESTLLLLAMDKLDDALEKEAGK